MLLYHYNESMGDIKLFQPHARRAWSVKKCQSDILEVKDHLLFIHSWSDCDTTSSIYGKGKSFAVKKIRQSVQLRDISGVFTSIDSNHAEVKDAAVTAFKLFYSSPVTLPMEKIRYNKYMELASHKIKQKNYLKKYQ